VTLAVPGHRSADGSKLDVALLPINGREPSRRVAGNLDAEKAALLARDLGARHVIPCHFAMFEFNTASPGPFVDACRRIGQPYTVLKLDQRRTFVAP
jgi:L-ascorbate metabolism protein UlaG (beta-lactamase superfamily)